MVAWIIWEDSASDNRFRTMLADDNVRSRSYEPSPCGLGIVERVKRDVRGTEGAKAARETNSALCRICCFSFPTLWINLLRDFGGVLEERLRM